MDKRRRASFAKRNDSPAMRPQFDDIAVIQRIFWVRIE
jgi:hypothetical protein